MRLLRRRSAVTPLDEAAAYARCHGLRANEVRVVKLPPRRERYDVLTTGEELRRLFEERLDARDPDVLYSGAGPSGPAPPPAVPPAA